MSRDARAGQALITVCSPIECCGIAQKSEANSPCRFFNDRRVPACHHRSTMILTQAELESLAQAQHRHPHQLLGMHPLGDGSGVVTRAYLHNAAQVEVLPVLEKSRPKFKLERVHESGLFEGVTKGSNKVYAYDLVI